MNAIILNLKLLGEEILLIIGVIISLGLIQISPIKINPIDAIKKLIRSFLGTQVIVDDIHSIREELERRTQLVYEVRAKDLRIRILQYARRKREGKQLDTEEIQEVFRIIDEYLDVVETYDIQNSYCEKSISYLKESL